ncbi:sugar-binding protein [Colwellia sp. RSH04]|uniref:sugar-binding protein n=1 Tax=Colwellia sp. RSH04 TaxID=2305464 RepID=UPI000E572FEC|nr:sugar-binding protein [Colwellia sp. RSH04]RHW75359.1 sugar-binding protein [Colwellia sp. RSH04]
MKKLLISLAIVFGALIFSSNAKSPIEVVKAKGDIVIDGLVNEKSWQIALWQPIDELILGTPPTTEDFSGRFKVLWDNQQLYLLVEITDDVLFDQHANPYFAYWDDDCLEVFIDEDASGGEHQFNHNAFAYHVALDNQVADIGGQNEEGSAQVVLLNDHITSVWRRDTQKPHNINWELSIRLFDDSFQGDSSRPVTLMKQKKIGFMLAYCDNDGSPQRESFIGSTFIKPIEGDKNLGYITADVFDHIILID